MNMNQDLSNINEWIEWHLTPRGWKPGNEKREFPPYQKEVEAPSDRVLTCRYHQGVAINSIWIQKYTSRIWEIADKNVVDEMIDKFGDCPESFSTSKQSN